LKRLSPVGWILAKSIVSAHFVFQRAFRPGFDSLLLMQEAKKQTQCQIAAERKK
jgi:hypothetical protein